MGLSSNFGSAGTLNGTPIAAMGTSFPDYVIPITPSVAGSYLVIPVNAEREKTYRGVELEFYGNIAATAWAANELWLGFSMPSSNNYLRVRQYGTFGVTTSSAAMTTLATEFGLTNNWYPASTISTAWSLTSYASNVVEPISLIASSMIAPSASDMQNAVLTLPYLDGATHVLLRCPNASSTNQLHVAARKISRDL